MKTIRQNVWETNSSSTHSVTLCVNSAAVPTMKPFSADGSGRVIKIGSYNSWEDEDWTTKIELLAIYLKTHGRFEELQKVLNIITDFAGFPITLDEESLNEVETFIPNPPTPKSEEERDEEDEYDDDEDNSEIAESLRDHFSYFISDYYGHDSVESFSKEVEKILADDKTILAFICSTGWFDVQGYYEG